ncbi:MAG TPA: DUF1538 domain-containing protein [Planctomycetaceae bacterium]|nr:DUF1538 domain-containing protein [Planctomycetaceae bacterium]
MPTRSQVLSGAKWFGGLLWASLRDLLPIIIVIGLFQVLVFQRPVENVGQLFVGMMLVVIGLTLFVLGLEIGLFPLGQQMAHDFARKGNVFWLTAFAFSLGFGTSFAEPALIAVAGKASELTVVASLTDTLASDRARFALILRATVAVAVGLALVIGVMRILLGWNIQYLITIGYLLIMVMTVCAPPQIVAIAYDSGGVTTSTITVPLTTALGVGLASSIKGRNPLLDGFGMIAMAALMPILFVLMLGLVY